MVTLLRREKSTDSGPDCVWTYKTIFHSEYPEFSQMPVHNLKANETWFDANLKKGVRLFSKFSLKLNLKRRDYLYQIIQSLK